MSATEQAINDAVMAAEAKKSASPVLTETKAQADDATFRIIGDAGPLFGALAAAQGAFLPIHKNRTVTVRPEGKQAYTFDYATLDQVLAACMPALSANGLALLQPFYHGPNGFELRTILAHSSGARLEAVTELPKVNNIQAAGSALTYLKRYQVQAILGVSSEEDDDGNAADGNKVENSQPRQSRATPAAPPQAKTGGKPANGSSAQPSKPAAKPEPAPQKPQDAPPPAAEPEPAQEAEKPAEASQEPASALQRKTLGDLVRWPGFKVTGSKVAQDLLLKVCGKSHTEMVGADFALVIDVLEQAKRLETYDAAGLMAYIDEVGGGEQAAKALRAEADAFLGGAS